MGGEELDGYAESNSKQVSFKYLVEAATKEFPFFHVLSSGSSCYFCIAGNCWLYTTWWQCVSSAVSKVKISRLLINVGKGFSIHNLVT